MVIPRLFDAGGGDVGISVLDAAGHKLGERHLALLNIIVFHAAGNTWSDYFDYKHKVDAKDDLWRQDLDRRDVCSARDIWLVDGIAGSCPCCGCRPAVAYGLPLLYIGIGGAACSLLYPPLKYRALGDVVIFLAYALLPTLGTCYVATGVVDWNVLWIALPVGLITVAILHANNTRDMRTDARAEIQTLAMKLGGKASMYVYCAEVLFPFGWIAGLIAAGTLPLWTLLVMPALVPAIGNVRVVSRFPEREKCHSRSG